MKLIFAEKLAVCQASRIPVLWISTMEEKRVEAEIIADSKRKGQKVLAWSETAAEGMPGWEELTLGAMTLVNPDSGINLVTAISDLVETGKKPLEETDIEFDSILIVIFRDIHHQIRSNPAVIRILRDASFALRSSMINIVCISPQEELHPDLVHDVELFSPGLPDKELIRFQVQQVLNQYSEEVDPDFISKVTDACTGLTLLQTEDTISKSRAIKRKIDVDYINEIKTESVNSIPGLTYYGNIVDVN